MGAYSARLMKREPVAAGTMAFYFDRPAGFEFAGGQSIDLTLINPPQTDAEGDTRIFSLASAPEEPHLMVATRLRDTAFKRTLQTLAPGTEVAFEGPFGSMTLHRKAARPAVMLAGGIGITPFRSMICQAVKAHAGYRLILFYSNRRPGDAAFLGELQGLAQQHPDFTLVATMTDLGASAEGWSGITGYINREMLMKFGGDLTGAVYYTAGPPALVAAMKGMILDAGVDEDDINSEGFAGY
jgi:ferredoxin-NADP reductase